MTLDFHFVYLAWDFYLLKAAITYILNVLQEIQSFYQYVLDTYFLLDTVLGRKDVPVTKINESPMLKVFTI